MNNALLTLKKRLIGLLLDAYKKDCFDISDVYRGPTPLPWKEYIDAVKHFTYTGCQSPIQQMLEETSMNTTTPFFLC